MYRQHNHTVRMLLLTGLLLVMSGTVLAERLPIRQYGVTDGLPTDAISTIYRDSRGFLWFCTHAGLSRFDGHRFVNYGKEHGLPVEVVGNITEDIHGTYWVTTWGGGGVSRFNPEATDPAHLFKPYRLSEGASERTTTLLADSSGRVWVGTIRGLFVRQPSDSSDSQFEEVPLADSSGESAGLRILSLMEDRAGNVWVATLGPLYQFSPTGETIRHRLLSPGAARPRITDLMEDGEGRIWASHAAGVIVFRPGEDPETLDPLPGPGEPHGLMAGSDGNVWISRYDKGLTRFDGSEYHNFTTDDGLEGYLIVDMAEDSAGNLWLATLDSGVLRIARTGFTAYDRADGLGYTRRARLVKTVMLPLMGEIIYIGIGSQDTDPADPLHLIKIGGKGIENTRCQIKLLPKAILESSLPVSCGKCLLVSFGCQSSMSFMECMEKTGGDKK